MGKDKVRPERAKWVKTDTGWTKGVDNGTLIVEYQTTISHETGELVRFGTEWDGYFQPHVQHGLKRGETPTRVYIGTYTDPKHAKQRCTRYWRMHLDNEWYRARDMKCENRILPRGTRRRYQDMDEDAFEHLMGRVLKDRGG